MLFSQLIKADSVLLYFEGNYSFSLHCCFQFTRTHTEGETPDTNCIAKVNILGHIVAQGRRKKKNEFIFDIVGVQPETKKI